MAMTIPVTLSTAIPLLVILVATLVPIGNSEMMMMPGKPDMTGKPDMAMMPGKPDMMMMPGKPDMMMMPGKPDMMMMPGNPMFVGMCKNNMSLDCGNRINIYLFGKGTPFPNSYCAELLSIGKNCHDAIVNKHITGKPHGFTTKALKKSDWLWEHCGRVVEYQKRRGHHH